MTKALDVLVKQFAERLDLGDGTGLLEALKATAFKPAKVNGSYVAPSDAQITALLVVANQYGLNPWTKEIYAFPDKHGGIVPVVGVDGWSRIINSHPQYDGLDFEQDKDKCTCTIHRKDRGHPTAITEWMIECNSGTGPWLTHPYRFLRHKALIQCARIAFGFVGIYEQDEAERIVEAIDGTTGEILPAVSAPGRPKRASETSAKVSTLTAPTDPVVLEAFIPEPPEPVADTQPGDHAEAPAAAKAAPQVADGPPASSGECMNVIVTARAKKANMSALLAEHGMGHLNVDTLTGLTKAQFTALKAALK